jgi:hypothetical protein
MGGKAVAMKVAYIHKTGKAVSIEASHEIK